MSRLMRASSGAALVELVVAMTLATILSAAAAAALVSVERYVRRATATSEDRRTLRDVELTLASELRVTALDSLRLHGDTAADFMGLVGTSVTCVASGSQLVLPPSVTTNALSFSVWRASPSPGDFVAVFDTASPGAWRMAIVNAVETRGDGAGCVPASGLLSAADSIARRPVTRLVLDRALPAGVGPGAPVRLSRRGRYVLTRAADRSWSLSYRACDAAVGCGVAQPVAGPLAAPTDSGLVFSLDATAARLQATLRAPSREPGLARESRRFVLTLRNRAAGAP
jgi:type II secretory pathway pseudopilin PulG